jgi:hypothetical protein
MPQTAGATAASDGSNVAMQSTAIDMDLPSDLPTMAK